MSQPVTEQQPSGSLHCDLDWIAGKWGVILASIMILVRLVFAFRLQLIPEEAYYWDYSRHPDVGYLDHPPLVAWGVWLSTAVFGTTEFTVRIPAMVSWMITTLFMFKLTRDLFDRAAARVCVVLLACLPYFFGAGLLMTPDSPVMAFWAGALYFLQKALLRGNRRAWLLAGVMLGLGLLSKYPILLLVPAAVLFAVLDPTSRRWFARPQPYLALMIAAILFTPVIWWNATHDWASFSFQSASRMEGNSAFFLHKLILHAVMLLSPFVLIAALELLFRHPSGKSCRPDAQDPARVLLFARVFTLVPLSVFVAASLFREVKPHWTGPVWLAILPVLSAGLVYRRSPDECPVRRCYWRWVSPSLLVLPLIAAGIFLLLTVFPQWLHPNSIHALPVVWRELGKRIEEIEVKLAAETGCEPLIAGLDTNAVSSEMAFYDPDGEGAHETAGSGLFGRKDLMYSHWFPPSEQTGRNIVVISRDMESLDKIRVVRRGTRVGPIEEVRVERKGRVLCTYYVRVVYGYVPPLFRSDGEFGVPGD
jgi:dolichol-phosphate mannosyltransferase